MLFCKKPFEQMYIGEDHVKTCPWMDLIIGNPIENNIEEMWIGEKAELGRQSIRDGSFRYCDKTACPYCASGRLEEIDEEIGRCYQAEPAPTYMNVSYDKFCNHACPSCRKDIYHPTKEYVEKMDLLMKNIIPFANMTETLSTCGRGDCFASPYMMKFLSELKPQNDNFRLVFETNGVFFDERHWKSIEHLHKYPISVIVTPNSFEKYTYRFLAGGIDDYDKCMNSMKFMSDLRHDGKLESLKINMVVQESNYREIPSFIHKCLEEFEVDAIRIKPLNRWFSLGGDEYWYMNVLNPLHPHHENYLAVMKDPIIKHEKVWDWTEENHDRDPQRYPAAYAGIYAELLYMLRECEDDTVYLKNKLKKYNVEKIAIYGAWRWGSVLYDIIKEVPGIKVEAFIDKHKGDKGRELKKLPIIGLWKEGVIDADMIIISVLSSIDSITRDLRRKGYEGIIISTQDLLS